ncbi:DUF805 domain-containing protein [Salipiger mucosus]|uniref:Integral membrane protein n=1 Tax=Salipiger mucosus DSM 16094 TaxID=1123237 RepID=S9S0I1_9RHOB|nr:DUF805 domain-containing protein [Salipiger mucosus]EPX79744.1 Integral membrane protein [Salipiger mucosus DSM 16094]
MFGPIAALESYVFNAFRLNARATRAEYWWPTLIVMVATFAAGAADAWTMLSAPSMRDVPTNPFAYWTPILSLLTVVPSFTAGIRRLHDSGRSGFWVLVTAVPLVGPLVLLILLLMPSEQGPNAWGGPRLPMGGQPGGPRPIRSNSLRPSNPLDSYAVLLQADAEPSPEEVARRKEEIHDYFMKNVSRRNNAA